MTARTAARRGHHHKHSMSHNFFSFLEPGMNSAPAPPPLPSKPSTKHARSPSNFASSSSSTTPLPINLTTSLSHPQLHTRSPSPFSNHSDPRELTSLSIACTISQFILGSWLWVAGQQVGSLSSTGLGYWVVFDAMGIGLGWVLPGWLDMGLAEKRKSADGEIRRPYGSVVLGFIGRLRD